LAKKKRNTGLPPGSAIYNGPKETANVCVNYIEFNQDIFNAEFSPSPHNVVLHNSREDIVQWYDIRGLHDEKLIHAIAEKFQMHPIAIEDATDIYQRPSYTEYAKGHFISLKSFGFNPETMAIEKQAVSIFFGVGFVISFQQFQDDIFEKIRKRIEGSKGKIRQMGSDYLAYALIDYLVDNYFTILDRIEIKVEELEDSIHESPQESDKSKIYSLKKELLKLRKSVAPLREAIGAFSRSESPLIDLRTESYIRDVYDHTIQIIDNVDSLRDILSGLQDLYISEISLKMNRIMQFFTIITSIFVPLSFLTGLYGMNFKNIPELDYYYGYYILVAFMILITIVMALMFKKKNWL